MADTTRNVEVKLKFTGDAGGGSKALADLQAQAGKAGKAIEDVNKQMKGGEGGDEGKNKLMFWAKFAAGVYVAQKAVEGLTKAMQLWGNESMTATGKVLKGIGEIGKSLPLVGGLIGSVEGLMREGMHGDKLRAITKVNEGMSLDNAVNASNDPIRGRQRDSLREWEAARFAVDARGGERRINAGLGLDLGRAAIGERLNRGDIRDDGVRAALGGKIGAQRDLSVAKSLHAQDIEEENIRAREMNKASANVANARNQLPLAANAHDQVKREADLSRAMNELARQRAMYEEQVVRAKQSGIDIAQKELAVSKASTEVQKAKLSLLQQQADKAKSGAEQFGAMSGAEKLALQSAISEAKAHGIDSLDEDRRGLILRSGLSQEWGAKQLEKSVQDDPVYRSIVAGVGGKTSQQLEAEVAGLKQEIEIKIEMDEGKLAVAMAKLSDQFFGKLVGIQRMAMQENEEKMKLMLQHKKHVEALP